MVEICRLVRGLPLGIVLAAAWVRHFPPARIAAAIRANLDFLTSTARDAAPQHRSLRAVFDHSWHLLSDDEQRVFRQLGGVPGRVGRGGRRAGRRGRAPLARCRWSINRCCGARPRGRFDIHEVLRQYAGEKLQDGPRSRTQVRQRHAAYYLDLAELAESGLAGTDKIRWLARLDASTTICGRCCAGRWSKAHAELGACNSGAALWRFWYIRGYNSEGRAALAAVLALPVEAGSLVQAPPLAAVGETPRPRAPGGGDLARAQGDYQQARMLCEESLALYRALGHPPDIATALNRLAIVELEPGKLRPDPAAVRREPGDRPGVGDPKHLAVTTGNLGIIAFVDGDYAAAGALLEESIALLRTRGDTFNLAIRLNNLGNVALMQGDYARARTLHQEGLGLRQELQDKWGIAVSLVGLGGAAIGAGAPEPGTRLLAAAAALLDTLGVQLELDDRIPYEHGIAAAQAALDSAQFAQVWAAGRALDLEQAIRDARAL